MELVCTFNVQIKKRRCKKEQNMCMLFEFSHSGFPYLQVKKLEIQKFFFVIIYLNFLVLQ